MASTRSSVVGFIAEVLRWAGLAVVVLLTLHVVLAVGGANQDNGITKFVTEWSQRIAVGFKDLFTPDDPKLRVLVDYGLAALFWLIVTGIVVRLVRRLG